MAESVYTCAYACACVCSFTRCCGCAAVLMHVCLLELGCAALNYTALFCVVLSHVVLCCPMRHRASIYARTYTSSMLQLHYPVWTHVYIHLPAHYPTQPRRWIHGNAVAQGKTMNIVTIFRARHYRQFAAHRLQLSPPSVQPNRLCVSERPLLIQH